MERPSQIRLRSGRHACLLAGAAVVALVLLAQPSPANPVSAAPGPCALPSATPLWIEYGDALTPDVRDVFA
ncbi:MAG: hypothetical protein ACXVZP_00490, partial [Gaiellaceae bacterium]